jgi:hypothetical protein
MTREAISLNGEKVRHLIARRGIPRKQLLAGRSSKTLQRILKGENTSPAIAHQLASELGVTMKEMCGPIEAEELASWLPELWLYENGPVSGDERSIPGVGCIPVIDIAPNHFGNPLAKLLAERPGSCRKIVLSRSDDAFNLEIRYFDYADSDQRVAYQFSVTCRFFPLSRDGDSFRKCTLSEPLKHFIWTWLHENALQNAELLDIEGEQYPAHPHAYRPLVLFSRGFNEPEKVEGVRLFSQLQVDFRESLIDYLDALPERTRIHACANNFGMSISAEPTLHEMRAMGGYHPARLDVVLVCPTPTGGMRLAPWRREHREAFAEAISQRRTRDFWSRGMPIRQDYPDDQLVPPMSGDPDLSAETVEAIKGIEWYDSTELLWNLPPKVHDESTSVNDAVRTQTPHHPHSSPAR